MHYAAPRLFHYIPIKAKVLVKAPQTTETNLSSHKYRGHLPKFRVTCEHLGEKCEVGLLATPLPSLLKCLYLHPKRTAYAIQLGFFSSLMEENIPYAHQKPNKAWR